VLGTPYEPGLAGRLIIEDGSELTLQERRYEVSRGIITFTSDRRIEPTLDIQAATKASNYDITLQISVLREIRKHSSLRAPCCPSRISWRSW